MIWKFWVCDNDFMISIMIWKLWYWQWFSGSALFSDFHHFQYFMDWWSWKWARLLCKCRCWLSCVVLVVLLVLVVLVVLLVLSCVVLVLVVCCSGVGGAVLMCWCCHVLCCYWCWWCCLVGVALCCAATGGVGVEKVSENNQRNTASQTTGYRREVKYKQYDKK